MLIRVAATVLGVLVVGGCRENSGAAGVVNQPVTPSAPSATSVERPWKAELDWSVTAADWAGEPFDQTTSLFDGRCSVMSDYIVYARFEGQATHVGRMTGETSHCTQLIWTPEGPAGATYGDGQIWLESADGSRLTATYGNSTMGVDPETGETWFQDEYTITGGTGRFEGATGGGQEGGRFADFGAVLAGVPVPMWQKGTITYAPDR